MVALAGDIVMEVPFMWRARRLQGSQLQGLFNVEVDTVTVAYS